MYSNFLVSQGLLLHFAWRITSQIVILHHNKCNNQNIKIMKKVMMTLMAVVFAIAANAQYNTNYYDQYGGYLGSSTNR